ncbi:hypothetical protein [Breoghania sp.]|uniref:hypothetical protein n=1 Tax=Breoghania sp. TaxID=2065378 RepID=UPI0026049804|nr:hypothetical protein [Breoghania sp.]MDJ0931940.1 hypothetical protein [Breoghania sp.]
MRDTHQIEHTRQSVIEAVRALRECFDYISAPRRFSGDPEISEQRMDEIRSEGEKARTELPKKATALEGAYREARQIV